MESNDSGGGGGGSNGDFVDDHADSVRREGAAELNHAASTCVYLTLGDGDFTYSADLAAYLSCSSASDGTGKRRRRSIAKSSEEGGTVGLVATGVDTLEELTCKYRDAPFILQQLRMQQEQNPSLSVSIRHGVNAVVSPDDGSSASVPPPPIGAASADPTDLYGIADHVMFHHPHLGTEDAALHCRFLAHLFHSATMHWMKKRGGVFHLTLVQGQFERWKVFEAATRHGMVLLNQAPFVPPPPALAPDVASGSQPRNGLPATEIHPTTPDVGGGHPPPPRPNRYHYRRHQSGRSFASRRPECASITYTFGRRADDGSYVARGLPWQQPPRRGASEPGAGLVAATPSFQPQPSVPMVAPCPHCGREFREERSRRCHVRDRHPETTVGEPGEGGSAAKGGRKGAEAEAAARIATHPCRQCQQDGEARVFQSAKALAAHVQAKHSAIHAYIAPDWSSPSDSHGTATRRSNDDRRDYADPTDDDICRICGWKLTGRSLWEHVKEFVPSEEATSTTFSCSFCSKPFREKRAKLQHENFCSGRISLEKKVKAP